MVWARLRSRSWRSLAIRSSPRPAGRPSSDYLKGLGATEVIERKELTGPVRPLGKERWAGGIDAVGSTTLANVLSMTRYGGAVAACGLAGGMDLPTSVVSPVKRSRAGCRSRSTRSTPRAGSLAAACSNWCSATTSSNPPKGLIAARELVSADVVAVFGGIDTPVSLAMVPLLNKEKRIYMGVWAAGTGITRNGANPNYAFRVSAVDALVDVRLLAYAHKKFAAKKAGLMLINNPWGQSNEKGLVAASKADPSIEIAGIEKFENNDIDMVPQLARLKDAGADAIILVVNAPPGAQVMKSRERMGWTAPVVSHWGISGGRFPELAGPTAGEAHFIQTYSFFGKQGPAGQRVLAGLMKKYPQIKGPEDVFAPVGTANAYDAMHILALGIAQAGSTDADAIRMALEDLKTPYEGLIKTFARPFTAENHDALGPDDYIMVHYEGDKIVPAN